MNIDHLCWAVVLTGGLVLTGCRPQVEPTGQADDPAPAPPPPSAAARPAPVTNVYHGVAVADEFQWLEHEADPAVQAWTDQQAQQARTFLESRPMRPWIQDRLVQLLSGSGPDYHSLRWQAGFFFALKSAPTGQQAALVTLRSVTNLNSEVIVADPNLLQTDGTLQIYWYEPSRDGRWAAVALGGPGRDAATLYLYSTADGKVRPEQFPRVHLPAAEGSVAWNADSSGFYYTRYPFSEKQSDPGRGFEPQVYFHRLGTRVDEDIHELGNDLPPAAGLQLKTSPDGRRVLASVSTSAAGDYAHYLRQPSGEWRLLAGAHDGITQAEFGRDPLYIEWGQDDGVYLLSYRQAPRGQILRVSLHDPNLTNATTVLAESKKVISHFQPAASGLCLVLMDGGPSQFAYFDYFENMVRRVDDRMAAVTEVLVLHGDEVLFRVESYTQPYEWLHYSPTHAKERLASTALRGRSPVSFDDVEVVRESVASKDGTTIPLNIISKRGTRLDGSNPTILSGSGGLRATQSPHFDVKRRLWLDQGGVLAIANLRGGAEFGESWYEAGAGAQKQKAFEDLVACANWLVRSNYTTAARLALHGRQQGGLALAVALTQHPNLCQAAIAEAGFYDLLRAETTPGGFLRSGEFGSVTDPDQFQTLRNYSPYHQASQSAAYPALLLIPGDAGGLVEPWHSGKLAARLQALTTSGRPVLLNAPLEAKQRERSLAPQIEHWADVYAFAADQLGLVYSQVDRGPWSGGVTSSSAVVKAKLVREGLRVRLVLSQSQSFDAPVFFGPAESRASQGNVIEFAPARLQPNTRYFYALEVDGLLDQKKAGSFRTFPPPGIASFTIAFSGDARTGSTHPVFDRIRDHDPLLFMNLGDFHYLNIQTNSLAAFRDGYDAVLASPQQSDLYRHVPFAYIWDDHDFAGNNSNRKASATQAARAIYDEYVPHYPMPLAQADRDGGPVAQTFVIGRVKFILTDLRSERDDARKRDDSAKTMFGAKQKAWFKRELLAANGKYPLICWATSVPWIGKAGVNAYAGVKTNQFGWIHHTQLLLDPNARTNQTVQDWWSVFSTERREIADFIKQHRIRGVCILHADSHMLAADDGSNSDYATGGGVPIPVMCAAPLDKEPSIKGGPYSQGVYRVRPNEGCFALFTVNDLGDRLDVTFSGRNHDDQEKVSLNFSVPAAPQRVDD